MSNPPRRHGRPPSNKTPPPLAAAASADQLGRWPNGTKLVHDNGRVCEVLDARRQEGTKWLYYVHWVDLNRRMDSWEPASALKELAEALPAVKKARPEGVIEFVEEQYGDGASMDAQSIREHEEVTKVKNVSKIQLGRYVAEAWFFSPIPKEFSGPDGLPLDTLYFCEFDLAFFAHESELARHYRRVKLRHPPGDEIYRDPSARLSMFEIDGGKAITYCQNLSYYAKFFLDHKTLQFDTQPFLFYVMCEFDEYGYHPVGYFSKEKFSEAGYNLACILTFPQYQRRGYGNFLISFSYELSKMEEKVGSPEKPLSDLGQIGYRSYWARALLDELRAIAKDPQATAVSIMDLTLRTAIRTDDVLTALEYMGLLNNGVLDVTVEALEACGQKIGTSAGPRVKPELLHWAPLKVDVKKDKWSMRSKVARRYHSSFKLPPSAGSGAMGGSSLKRPAPVAS